ncbi:hypothetical protein D3C83_206050 [compost metagenome]
MTACRVVVCRSTVGESPVTVTVSSSVPTRITASLVVVNVPVSTTPSVLTMLNPASEKLTV